MPDWPSLPVLSNLLGQFTISPSAWRHFTKTPQLQEALVVVVAREGLQPLRFPPRVP